MHPFKLKISDAGKTEEKEGENLGDVALCMWLADTDFPTKEISKQIMHMRYF